jgi:hypothetical protein
VRIFPGSDPANVLVSERRRFRDFREQRGVTMQRLSEKMGLASGTRVTLPLWVRNCNRAPSGVREREEADGWQERDVVFSNYAKGTKEKFLTLPAKTFRVLLKRGKTGRVAGFFKKNNRRISG